jgi:N-acetylmuramoyl-L-alanine amidase
MRPTFLFLLALLLTGALSVQAHASPSKEFNAGWQEFHRLLKNPKQAQLRSSWMAVKDRFWNAYNQSPKGAYAPKSLYYLGRVYQELGARSHLKSDAHTAVDYFQRLVSHFPDHSWSDDGLFMAAEVQRKQLRDPAQSYITLLRIVHNYPKGDMFPKAQEALREMDQANLKKPPVAQTPPLTNPEPKPSIVPAGIGSLARLEQIRHWSSDDYTRVVLDMDREVSYSHRLLNPDPSLGTPHRLLLDIAGTRLAESAAHEYSIADGILRQVRSGQYQHDQARIVLDIQQLDTFRIFSLENPYRVVIDVYAGGKATSPAAPAPTHAALDTRPDIRPETLSGSLVEQLGLTVQTIMLDAGHGGKDPGAVFGGIHEKDINLRMVKILGRMLEEKGFKVLYTRTMDKFIPLDERTAMANTQKADLFISIHCNAHPNRKVEGFELYYLNLAKTEDAVRVAARENAVSVKKISDLQVILTDLMLNSKIKESSQLARDVHARATTHLGKIYRDFSDHGVREAPFYVLMGAKMPAILVEMGYITNANDAARLSSDAYLTNMSKGLVDGIAEYKQHIERFASIN